MLVISEHLKHKKSFIPSNLLFEQDPSVCLSVCECVRTWSPQYIAVRSFGEIFGDMGSVIGAWRSNGCEEVAETCAPRRRRFGRVPLLGLQSVGCTVCAWRALEKRQSLHWFNMGALRCSGRSSLRAGVEELCGLNACRSATGASHWRMGRF